MCGICGIASRDSAIDRERLDEMSRSLAHRGPDSEGTFLSDHVGLAARRLAIIDLDHGDQPVGNEDGSVQVVQNGEIYNYRSLRGELEQRGHRFHTQGDTEVLAHLYDEYGDGFVDRLRGMFAIALWDEHRQRLLLARDRFGIKPLAYRIVGSELSFASEVRALQRDEIDLDALEAYLAFNSVPTPFTIFHGTSKLPAGHVLTWDMDGHQLTRFARPLPVARSALRRDDDAALAEELRERLRDSVRAHLVSDVPVGVLLSGGIDSSVLTALAAMEGSGPVRTFSVGFEERSFDELASARLVAQRYGTNHREVVLRPDVARLMSDVADACDEPFGDSSALPMYLVSRLAAEDVKVVLSGEGGDELFGGYETYTADLLAGRVALLARIARPLVERLPSSSSRVSLDYKAKRFVRAAHLPPLERHHGWKEIFSRDVRAALTGRRSSFDPVDLLRASWDETADADGLARLQAVDLHAYLVDDLLVKTDRMSMAHSLESRVPFLDAHVADLALALPARLRARGLQKKILLRRAAVPWLPTQIVTGRKRGFSIPAAAWLRGQLEPFARDVLAEGPLRRQGFFDPSTVGRLLGEHVEGREDHSRQLWGLLAFTLWYERHVEARPASVPVAGPQASLDSMGVRG